MTMLCGILLTFNMPTCPKCQNAKMPKHQNIQNSYMAIFFDQGSTLEGSLGQIGMETQTMVERPSIFLIKINNFFDKILAVRLEGLFWAWPLEASHYGCPSRESMGSSWPKVWTLGWPLKASHYAQPNTPIPIF
jgi:hypothetical protein